MAKAQLIQHIDLIVAFFRGQKEYIACPTFILTQHDVL
jgi:hypothetical protein